MPQLVQGGKYVFGWSYVREEGIISIPPEAYVEYNYRLDDKVILISGSKTSGGFSIIKLEKLIQSPLTKLLDQHSISSKSEFSQGDSIKQKNKKMYFTIIEHEYSISIPKNILAQFEISLKTHILAVRGSALGLSYLVKGPIYQEAKKHPELEIFN